MRGPRRGRLAALAASAALAPLTVVLLSTADPSFGQAVGCTLPNPDCTSTTSIQTTSTVPATTTTTTVLETTTTTFVPTTTTFRSTPATQAAAQSTTTTTVEVPTSHNVLIPGDGTEGAESTTTTTEVATTISKDGTSDGTLVALVVGGLVLLAVVVGILTWRYWVATRPPAAPTVGSDHG